MCLAFHIGVNCCSCESILLICRNVNVCSTRLQVEIKITLVYKKITFSSCFWFENWFWIFWDFKSEVIFPITSGFFTSKIQYFKKYGVVVIHSVMKHHLNNTFMMSQLKLTPACPVLHIKYYLLFLISSSVMVLRWFCRRYFLFYIKSIKKVN